MTTALEMYSVNSYHPSYGLLLKSLNTDDSIPDINHILQVLTKIRPGYSETKPTGKLVPHLLALIQSDSIFPQIVEEVHTLASAPRSCGTAVPF
jgi:hypothetical protein